MAAAAWAFMYWWVILGTLFAIVMACIEKRDDARRRANAALEERARQDRAARTVQLLKALEAKVRNLDTPCTCSRCARLPVDQRGH